MPEDTVQPRVENKDTVPPRVEDQDTVPPCVENEDTLPPRVENQDTKPVSLISPHDCFLRAIENANQVGQHLVQLLHGPRRKHWWAEDGSLMMEATTYRLCKRKLDFALTLLYDAREHATTGATTARTLTHREMTWALDWLKDCLLYTSDAADE